MGADAPNATWGFKPRSALQNLIRTHGEPCSWIRPDVVPLVRRPALTLPQQGLPGNNPPLESYPSLYKRGGLLREGGEAATNGTRDVSITRRQQQPSWRCSSHQLCPAIARMVVPKLLVAFLFPHNKEEEIGRAQISHGFQLATSLCYGFFFLLEKQTNRKTGLP